MSTTIQRGDSLDAHALRRLDVNCVCPVLFDENEGSCNIREKSGEPDYLLYCMYNMVQYCRKYHTSIRQHIILGGTLFWLVSVVRIETGRLRRFTSHQLY